MSLSIGINLPLPGSTFFWRGVFGAPQLGTPSEKKWCTSVCTQHHIEKFADRGDGNERLSFVANFVQRFRETHLGEWHFTDIDCKLFCYAAAPFANRTHILNFAFECDTGPRVRLWLNLWVL